MTRTLRASPPVIAACLTLLTLASGCANPVRNDGTMFSYLRNTPAHPSFALPPDAVVGQWWVIISEWGLYTHAIVGERDGDLIVETRLGTGETGDPEYVEAFTVDPTVDMTQGTPFGELRPVNVRAAWVGRPGLAPHARRLDSPTRRDKPDYPAPRAVEERVINYAGRDWDATLLKSPGRNSWVATATYWVILETTAPSLWAPSDDHGYISHEVHSWNDDGAVPLLDWTGILD